MSPDPDLDDLGRFRDDGGSMRLVSGRKVNPLRLTADEVSIDDIAHSLARLCRFNGHVSGFLSVARHSLWVAERLREVGRTDLELTGLLHDAAEAYLGDMIRPLKHGDVGEVYRVAEERVEAAVAERFGLEHPWPAAVKEADTWVLLEREMHDARWTWHGSPEQDEVDFVWLFGMLGGGT